MKRENIVEVNGKQVYSTEYIFELEQYQGARIDRCRAFAKLAYFMSVLSFLIAMAAIILSVIF